VHLNRPLSDIRRHTYSSGTTPTTGTSTAACAAISDYLKHRELLIERRPGLLDSGPLREVDQEILASLPASVPIETRHQVRLILVMTSDMAKHDAKLAPASGLACSRNWEFLYSANRKRKPRQRDGKIGN
jgi:hypothetical protein